MEQNHFKLKLKNASQLVCISQSLQKFKVKEDLQNIHILEDASVVVGLDGNIVDLGSYETIETKYKDAKFDKEIDCVGKSIVPGLVDGHTHAICPGDRVHEFIMKLEGATYMDIHKIGGGIGFTVEHVKKSTVQELADFLLDKLNKMAKLGTTTVEVKSGYGLDTENEIKMLKAITLAKKQTKLDIVSNYCGAHSIPKGMNEEEATLDIINNQLPAVEKAMQTGEIDPEFIDVFCEVGVYERASTKRILEAGQKIGLKINFHGDEIKFTDSGTLGAELNATAISHLENLDEAGIKAMAEKEVAAVILPTTHYLLKLKDPPVRQLIQGGVIFALGSDFNPNAYCLSMPTAMNFACINLKALPKESLVAATLNAAASMNRSSTVGSIEVGKKGDFVILETSKWDYLVYQFGSSPIQTVIKAGEILHQAN